MALPLQGCHIALSGTFKLIHAKLAVSIEENGGTLCTKITKACSHLVASEKDFEGDKTKVKQAQGIGSIIIVHYGWLVDSIEKCTKLDETPYLLTKQTQPEPKFKTYESPKKWPLIENRVENVSASEPPAKKQKDGQKAASNSLFVGVDDCVVQELGSSYRVFIAPNGIIYDALLSMTNAGENNNKFYRIQLLVSTTGIYKTWTRWSRVGDIGQTKALGDGTLQSALFEYNKKFKEKAGLQWDNRLDPPKSKKYTFLERNYDGGEAKDSDDDHKDDAEGKYDDQVLLGIATKDGGKGRTNGLPVVESKLPKPVQRLMEMIFNRQYFARTMEEMSYDAERLPLKDLSKRVLDRGFQTLKDIAELLYNPSLANEKHNTTYNDAIETLSNAYYTTIPHDFGRNRAPIVSREERLLQEIKLLESLTDMEIAGKIMQDSGLAGGNVHTLDRQFAGLNLDEMSPCESSTSVGKVSQGPKIIMIKYPSGLPSVGAKTDEYMEIERYLQRSHGVTHDVKLKIQDIFRVKRNGEEERFNLFTDRISHDKSDRRLLWHGSRCTNFGGILSQGLRIAPPEAPVNGYAFGKGVYLADISSKSANYCCPEDSGNTGLILLCEAELGHPKLELLSGFEHPDYPALAESKGCASTFGKGQTSPGAWKDAACVHPSLSGVTMPDMDADLAARDDQLYRLMYNEYIVYNTAQVKLRYLLRIQMTQRY